MPESGDFPATKNQERSRVKLRVCDPSECEARCCYDGVYLEDGEEAKINEIVASALGFFRKLPADFIMNGSWGDGRITGRKTAVRPYDFKAADFPAHFSRTRCVFCSEDHKCLLQVLAVQRGLHKWTYKPKACWMFPMELDDGKPAPPPSVSESDPQCLDEEYPGFVKFVPCGRDRPDGDPWDKPWQTKSNTGTRQSQMIQEFGCCFSKPDPRAGKRESSRGRLASQLVSSGRPS